MLNVSKKSRTILVSERNGSEKTLPLFDKRPLRFGRGDRNCQGVQVVPTRGR